MEVCEGNLVLLAERISRTIMPKYRVQETEVMDGGNGENEKSEIISLFSFSP